MEARRAAAFSRPGAAAEAAGRRGSDGSKQAGQRDKVALRAGQEADEKTAVAPAQAPPPAVTSAGLRGTVLVGHTSGTCGTKWPRSRSKWKIVSEARARFGSVRFGC